MSKLLFAYLAIIHATSAIFLSDEHSLIKAATLIKTLNPAFSVSSLPPAPFPQSILRGGCPLCDRSVYSYCTHRMYHDACCCRGGNVPFPCSFHTDCTFLNAKSCYEHDLLSTCCCNNPYH